MQPFRVTPNGRPQDYVTYGLRAPLATHHRKATCQEVNCGAYQNGWRTKVDTAIELGAKQANYIRMLSGRSFTYEQTGSVVTFTFPAGQQCFAEHTKLLEREPLWHKRAGDWRLSGRAVSMQGEDWLDDFVNHQAALKAQIERG